MRASFCSELMNYATNMPISKNEAYMMGMFSTLNYLIDAPLEEILSEVPVSDEIKDALLHKTGRCGMLYELVLSYEAADWGKISSLAEQLGIPNGILTSVYFVCMENVNTIWEQLTNASDPSSQPAASQPEQAQEEA
jgi:EAL and modified HD-GYP domain-containing signal transduction protein